MVREGFNLFIHKYIFIYVCTQWKKQSNICRWSMTVRVGDCGNDLSGNGVEIVSIMGCLLHCSVVVLSASGILGHSLLLPPPLCHPLTEPVCVCVRARLRLITSVCLPRSWRWIDTYFSSFFLLFLSTFINYTHILFLFLCIALPSFLPSFYSYFFCLRLCM